MAFSALLRRASTSVVPLAIRSVGSPRSFRGAISTALNVYEVKFNACSVSLFQNFSTGRKHISDENLIRIVKNEIKCAEEEDLSGLEETPSNFPFEIRDNPGERTVTLKRKYEDEEISVEVDMPSLVEEGEQEEEKENEDDENEGKVSLPLVVNVSKGGDGLSLEFSVTAYDNEIEIDSLVIKRPDVSLDDDAVAYEGPDFEELDPELQKELIKFLEIRGINANMTNYLRDYMIGKDNKEYLQWLNGLKHFVEK